MCRSGGWGRVQTGPLDRFIRRPRRRGLSATRATTGACPQRLHWHAPEASRGRRGEALRRRPDVSEWGLGARADRPV